MKERWSSPFPYTLAFNLFKKHITELNWAYWAFVPVSNTIKKSAKTALKTDDADPKTYFLIPDEDDRRIASTFSAWKADFRSFENYTRHNMIMLMSSCFETYLRTITSLAFESKPGVIIMCPDSVDGVFLLKNKQGYGNCDDKNYQFADHVDEICRGEWTKRFSSFERYFGTLPQSVTDQTSVLDELRTLRNNIGHYLGRRKADYVAPLYFAPLTPIEISHQRVLKYFKLINDVAKKIDMYLKENVIGSYDIIKFYFQQASAGAFKHNFPGGRARDLQNRLGQEGFPPVGNEYYRNIISFFDLDDDSAICKYTAKSCIQQINRSLSERGITLYYDKYKIPFSRYHFRLFIKANNWRADPDFCQVNKNNPYCTEYCYSVRLINSIVDEVCRNPSAFVHDLQVRIGNNS